MVEIRSKRLYPLPSECQTTGLKPKLAQTGKNSILLQLAYEFYDQSFNDLRCRMASSTSRGTVTKKVLVELGDDSLPVSFMSGVVSDYESVRESTAMKAGVDADDLVLKVKSEEFGGRWVNLSEEDTIADKSVIMCVIRTSKV